MKQLTRLKAPDNRPIEPTVSERMQQRLLLPRTQQASTTPTARELITRAYQDAIFVEAMPSELRGMMSIFAVGLLATGSLMLYRYISHAEWTNYLQADMGWKASGNDLFFWLLGLVLTIFTPIIAPLGILGGIRGLRFDLTVPKENPIVFNRRTRKVYRFMPDVPGLHLLVNKKGNFSLWGLLKYVAMTFLPWSGMILIEYDWDCIEAEYFSQTGPSGNVIRTQDTFNLFVREAPGSDIVIDSFPLLMSYMVAGEQNARHFWEHIRRFMEEGGPALSPGDRPAPPPPRSAWQAVCAGPLKRYWIWFFLGAIWTTPELFYSFASSFLSDWLPENIVEQAGHFPRPDMISWWMLYPVWSRKLSVFFYIIKAGLALFVFYPATAMGFFAVIASKLSPEAELPDDLAADAGCRIDLDALAAVQAGQLPHPSDPTR